jgi:hypothetical protein
MWRQLEPRASSCTCSSANCLQVPTTAPARSTTISGATGAIRAGRPLAVKQKLIKQICASWCEITGQSGKQLVAGLTEIASDVTYGLILPHPGGETEWFATNADALDGIQGTGL